MSLQPESILGLSFLGVSLKTPRNVGKYPAHQASISQDGLTTGMPDV